MPDTAERPPASLETIVALERRAAERSTPSERWSDALLRVIGTLGFVAFHLVALALWVIVNLNAVPIVPAFDPFPFGILTLIVSTEGVFLCLFVLISQNRMTREANHRAHLNLEISVLAEKESTKMLQMLQELIRRTGDAGPVDDEARQLSQPTNVADLAEKLQETLK
jgi:uncharacterized membrane protein